LSVKVWLQLNREGIAVSQLIKELFPSPLLTGNLTGVFDGRLLFENSHEAPVQMLVDDSILQALGSRPRSADLSDGSR